MSVIGIMALVVCVVGYVATWRLVFRAIASDCWGGPDWADILEGVTIATIAGAVFPLVLIGYAVRRLASDDPAKLARILGGESRAAKEERREREIWERDRRIAELERELVIR